MLVFMIGLSFTARAQEHDGNTRIEMNIIFAVEDGRELPLDLYIPQKELAKGKALPVVMVSWLRLERW